MAELESKLAASEQEKQALVSQVNHLLAQVAELTRQVRRGGGQAGHAAMEPCLMGLV